MEEMYDEALSLYNNNRLKEAIVIFMKLLESEDSNPNILNFLGISFYRLADAKNAEIYLTKAIELDNKKVEFITNLGILYLSLKNYDLALKYLNDAYSLNDNYIDCLINLSEVKRRTGDYIDAQKIVSKALTLDSNNVYVNKQAALLNKAKGNLSAAIGDYTRILNTFPEELDSMLKLAEIYVELNIFNEALNLYKKAFMVDPSLKNDLFLKGTLHQIYNRLFPSNRFEFYNSKLISKIKNQLVSFEIKNKKVVEVQGIESILSMICAKEGAKVTVINDEEFFIKKAEVIAKDNMLEKNIIFIEKNSLILDDNEISMQDLVITEMYYKDLPDYQSLLSIYNFKNRFLSQNGKLFPEKIKLKAKLIESESLYNKNSANFTEGIDISSLNYYRSLYLYEDINRYEHKFLSNTIDLQIFDLYKMPEQEINKQITLKTLNDGTCHGILFWSEKYFNNESLEIDEDMNTLIYLFDTPISLTKENSYDLSFVYSNIAMFFLNQRS